MGSGFRRNPLANLTVVFHITLAQVVDQKGQMQNLFLLNGCIHAAYGPFVPGELRRPMHGPQAVFIHGVLVVIVELHKVPRVRIVGSLGHDLLAEPVDAEVIPLVESSPG